MSERINAILEGLMANPKIIKAVESDRSLSGVKCPDYLSGIHAVMDTPEGKLVVGAFLSNDFLNDENVETDVVVDYLVELFTRGMEVEVEAKREVANA